MIKECDLKKLNLLVRKENRYKPNVCSLIRKIKLIVLPFFSYFSNFLYLHIYFSAGEEILINISFQELLVRLLTEDHFLYLCVNKFGGTTPNLKKLLFIK